MKLRVFSFALSLILIVVLINFVFTPDGNATDEKSLKSASGNISFKITPGSTSIKAGKHKKFHLKKQKNGKLVSSKKDLNGLVWSVNGIPHGNDICGTIDDNGIYQAPKNIPSPNSVTISVSGLNGDYEITSALVRVIPKNITRGGKLALKVKWIPRNKLTPLAEGEIPGEVKQVRGVAVNDLTGEHFLAGPVDVATRTLAFSNVPLEGTYTVTLEGLDASGNTIYSGTVTGIQATPIGETPKPAIIYLTIVSGEVEVSSITPEITEILVKSIQQFSASVTGAFDPTGKPVEWSVMGGSSFGTITSDGLYKAPLSVEGETTATVRARSKADPSKFKETSFKIIPEISVSVSPQTAHVQLGGAVQFEATVTGADDISVTWYVNDIQGGNSTVGTIDSNGLYTTPSGLYSTPVTVKAKSNEDSSKSDTAEVTIIGTTTTTTTTTTTSTTTTTIAISMVFGKVTDVQTQAPIEGALVEIISSPGSGGSVSKTTLTDVNGSYTFEVPPGQYDVTISKAKYKDFTSADVTIPVGSFLLDAALSPDTLTIAVGSVSGKVTDNTGVPVSGAVVQIDGGAQTNGIFAATNTDSNGFYTIDSIPVKDTAGVPIPSFTVTVAKSGFESANKAGVIVNANTSTANIDFTLAPVIANNVIFKDDFETDKGWITDGFWHRIQNGSGTKNILVPDYVTLSPDDTSGGAIPNAFSGELSYWYGQDSTGSYIGEQIVGDSLLSGGTSLSSNFGTLTSPVIDLTNTVHPVLRFWSWWEIEGVAPNENGFDIMGIKVSENGGETFTEIKKLNPFTDPVVVDDRADKPYTSAGFFNVPVWSFYEIDLSSYAGKSIILRFEFDTVDSLYNGFRGWFIDDLTVED